MLLSVIVPVFNVEEYLEKCISSIMKTNLPLKRFEVLLINDGSTDNSPQICDYFEKKHKNIKVIHKKNGGLSDARNCGILNSRGKYIAFVDSDDFIKENSFDVMLKSGEKYSADIVVGNAFKYKSPIDISPKYKKRDKNTIIDNGEIFLVNSVKEKTMSMSVVIGIYKRDMLINHKLFFAKGLLHEDELWTPITYLCAEKVVYINHDFYFHFERLGSITKRNNKIQNSLDLIKICYILNEKYQHLSHKESKKILNDYLSMLYLNAVFVGKLHKTKYNNLINILFPLKNASSLRNYLKSILFIVDKNLYYNINRLTKKP